MYNFFSCLITLIFLLSHFSALGQSLEQKKDSLLLLVEETKEDTNKVQLYNSISKLYSDNNPPLSIFYAKKALKLSQESKFNEGISTSYGRFIKAYFNQGKNADSVLILIELYEKHLLDIGQKHKMHRIHLNYGLYYHEIGELDKAVEAYLEGLELVRADKTLSDKDRRHQEARCFNNLGVLNYQNGKPLKALEYYQEGLALVNNGVSRAARLYNMAHIYKVDLNQVDTAMIMIDEAYEIFKENNHYIGMVSALGDKAGYHDSQKAYERANQLYQEAFQIATKNNLGYNLLYLHLHISKHYQLRELHDKAIFHAQEAVRLAKEQKILVLLKDIYDVLQQNYAAVGNFQKAHEASLNLLSIRDSISNTELKTKIEELQTKFSVEQTKTENNLLKAERIANQEEIQRKNITGLALLLGLLLLGTLATVVFINNKRKQRYNEELETIVAERTFQLQKANTSLEQANYELKTFNYIASHDIKEPIRNIGNYAGLVFKKLPDNLQIDFKQYFNTIKTSTQQLYTLIEDFSRYTQMSKTDEIKTQEVDLNIIVNNMELSLNSILVKSNGKIVNEGLPTVQNSASFLYTILKNLVENGLKFNEATTPTVTLSSQETENMYTIFVKDNGIGIDPIYKEQIFEMFKKLHHRNKYEGSGIGLAIVKLLTTKINAEIDLASNDSGSTFILKLPK